ncbi:hypothetical protein OCEANICA350_20088 [Oceanicaulis sp. 350]|nr:hypothetical protein OCEANICA350_20088 [Oceanicaulis sp. 350]
MHISNFLVVIITEGVSFEMCFERECTL